MAAAGRDGIGKEAVCVACIVSLFGSSTLMDGLVVNVGVACKSYYLRSDLLLTLYLYIPVFVWYD